MSIVDAKVYDIVYVCVTKRLKPSPMPIADVKVFGDCIWIVYMYVPIADAKVFGDCIWIVYMHVQPRDLKYRLYMDSVYVCATKRLKIPPMPKTDAKVYV